MKEVEKYSQARDWGPPRPWTLQWNHRLLFIYEYKNCFVISGMRILCDLRMEMVRPDGDIQQDVRSSHKLANFQKAI